jgi:hypothetical protein
MTRDLNFNAAVVSEASAVSEDQLDEDSQESEELEDVPSRSGG